MGFKKGFGNTVADWNLHYLPMKAKNLQQYASKVGPRCIQT